MGNFLSSTTGGLLFFALAAVMNIIVFSVSLTGEQYEPQTTCGGSDSILDDFCSGDFIELVSPLKFSQNAAGGGCTSSCPFNDVNVGVRGTATFVGFLTNLVMIGILWLNMFEGFIAKFVRFVMWGVAICAFSSAVLDTNAVRIGNDICLDNNFNGGPIIVNKNECLPGNFIGMVFAMIFVTTLDVFVARLFATKCAGMSSDEV